jgi:hypothetical protein
MGWKLRDTAGLKRPVELRIAPGDGPGDDGRTRLTLSMAHRPDNASPAILPELIRQRSKMHQAIHAEVAEELRASDAFRSYAAVRDELAAKVKEQRRLEAQAASFAAQIAAEELSDNVKGLAFRLREMRNQQSAAQAAAD